MPKSAAKLSQCQYNQGLADGSIDGIDMRAGVRRVGGNPATYARMLQMFCDTHAGAALALMAALGNGERDNAERIAHSINGVAANLGAQRLSDAAAALERALASQSEDDELIDAFAAALAQTVAGIRAALDAAAQPASQAADMAAMPGTQAAAGQAVPRQQAADALAGLSACLDNHSGETIDYLEQHAAALRAALGEPAYEQLALAIGRFEFSVALAVLAAHR